MWKPSSSHRMVVAAAALWAGASFGGCDANGSGLFSETPASTGAGGGGGTGGTDDLPPTKSDSVDLLLVIDNSRSMADKQQILALTIPDLIASFVNPPCVDAEGAITSERPSSPSIPCPVGSRRAFPPVTDLHVGVITTSIGGHGSDACDPAVGNNANGDDRAHLIDRAPGGGTVDTYEGLGFLAWDPNANASPAGEDDPGELQARLGDLVLGAGQEGCGFEAVHESWYRFLIEPDPHEEITISEGGEAMLVGTDDVLLEQRKAFLRPDSLLAIITLSDENDCSIRDGGQFYFAAQLFTPGTSSPYHLPRPRAACAEDPNDPCCVSCGQPPGPGCDASMDQCDTPLPAIEDHVNLRCWQQKRRFGVDFLWPIDRYVAGLTDSQIADRKGNVVPNPLFSDLDPSDTRSRIRDPRLVLYGTFAGVPWQDIARQSTGGSPDLAAGLDAQGRNAGGFQTADELAANGTWGIVLGIPNSYFTDPRALPLDPLMIESIDPRTGENPILEEPLAPPGSTHDANSINGHEYTISDRGDLQYACIFPLPRARNCNGIPSCDCADPGDNPLCQQENDTYSTLQVRAKAYPGLRQLELAQRLELRAAVGSVCPAQLTDPSRPDFGYRPFVRTLVESVEPVLSP